MDQINNAETSPPNQGRYELEQASSKNLPLFTLDPSEKADLEGGLDIGRIFDILRRRVRVIAGVTVLVIGVVVLWNRTRPPVYDGSFKMLIEPVTAEGQVVSSLNGTQNGGTSLDDASGQSARGGVDYPTQIEILRSPKLLTPVVQKLRAKDPDFTYGTIFNNLLITQVPGQQSKTVTKILEIHLQGDTADAVEQTLGLISQRYIQYSVSERQTNVRRAVQFVDEQLPKVQSQVRTLESALQSFREKNQLTDPTSLGSQLSTQLAGNQQQLSGNQLELEKTKQLYRSLEQQLQLQPKSAEAASVLSETPDYQVLVRQLQDLDVELQTLSADLTPENPKIVALKERRSKLLPLIQAKANTVLGKSLSVTVPDAKDLPFQSSLRQGMNKQYIDSVIQLQVLGSQQKALNTARQGLMRQNIQVPLITRQYEDLQRKLKISSEQLSKFLQVRQDLMINAARQEVPWEIVASPQVRKIASSSLPVALALGTILGAILGTGVALLLESINNVIHTVKDLRAEIGIPILGMIPKQDSLPKPMSNAEEFDREWNVRYRFSPFIEAFRSLNSQIRLLRPDLPIHSLVISSSLPEEGKTTVATQLARAAAAMGQRVLLIDTDLRKPSLQELIVQESMGGLTDVITEGLDMMDAIQVLPEEENLHLMFAGSVALDPTSLLGSKKMSLFMEKCRAKFDLVIYDATPLSFADSLLLIPQTDGLLMVAQLGRIHRETLRNTMRTLEVARIPVLGVVANMVSDAQFSAGIPYGINKTMRVKVVPESSKNSHELSK
jgi:polysaccharide biosynthesis transport protein